MIGEEWDEIKAKLHAAMELGPAERDAYLKEVAAASPELYQELQSLLASYERAGPDFLNSSAAKVVLLKDNASAIATIGKRIGPYQIIEQIGTGGMGEVYRAFRADDQYQKQVAIKLVRAGQDSGFVLSRFKNERQILASLDHPNIARLFDGGTTEEGVPYFVMELIDGEPIDEYCNHRKLPVSERLRLFLQVCSAVQYAHQRLIIHRDIKPGNILVTSEGVAKLLDFGIAKILDAEAVGGRVEATLTVFRVMTPGYASPEQIKGEPITTTSDVYSLGVVLYELLTGRHPYRRADSTPQEVARAACETEPDKPSKAVWRTKAGSDADAAQSGASRTERASDSAEKLSRNLRGDLDNIILMAMRKEPQRRYASVQEFGEDIRRHLETLPVIARKDTARYRAAKFIRRNKVSVLTTAVFACLALVAGLATGFYYHSLHGKRLTEQDTIVLADFDNKTGDAVFDDALKEAFAMQLEQSPFLNVISDRKVSETLRLMGHPAKERITMEIGRDLCFRTGSKALLGGTIASLGSQYVINIKAIACSTGDILAKEQVEANGKDNVLTALSRACSNVRSQLGESLASVQKYDVPPPTTTASLEALRSYSMGIKTFSEKGNAPSIPFLERAIDLDPNFPMAYVSLAIAHGNQGEQILSAEYAKKAYQLRDRATELEKFRIDQIYFSSTGEFEKENQSYELCIATYPRDWAARVNLGLSIANTTGQFQKALSEYKEALRFAPPDVVEIYEGLGLAYLSLDRLDDAEAAFGQALARKLDSAALRQNMYYLAFLRGDESRMKQLVASSAGQAGTEDLLLSAQSDTEAYYGRLNAARDFSRQAVASALRADSKETAGSWSVNAALREAELGNTALAGQAVEDTLRLSPGRFVKMQAALALARIGDTRQAKALAEQVVKSNPSFVLLKFYWAPLVDAAIRLNRGDAAKALVDLETASPYESHQLGNLYAAYERGQAYLLAHNGAAAAVEFQKLLDHRGLVMNFVTGALVHLQIARAYAMMGETDKAKAAYRDFFSLWKDADAGIPLLTRAQAEYGRLN